MKSERDSLFGAAGFEVVQKDVMQEEMGLRLFQYGNIKSY